MGGGDGWPVTCDQDLDGRWCSVLYMCVCFRVGVRPVSPVRLRRTSCWLLSSLIPVS